MATSGNRSVDVASDLFANCIEGIGVVIAASHTGSSMSEYRYFSPCILTQCAPSLSLESLHIVPHIVPATIAIAKPTSSLLQ